MKILIVGDVHWSEYSSIVRKRGPKFSRRLENLINSVNWCEELAETTYSDMIVYLGDFFDRTELNADELTALQEVVWANIPHKFIVGNHEGLNSDLSVSSAHIFSMIPQATVVAEPTLDVMFGLNLMYLPYVMEADRKPISQYFKVLSAGMFTTQEVKQTLVFSHNDIKMKYGLFESTEGFDVHDIENSCTLFFNGHLHNGSKFCSNGYNVGNITGQNFGEDANLYTHQALIYDTETNTLNAFENPYAFNFYRLEAMSEAQVNHCISELKDNSIVTIKVPESCLCYTRKTLSECSKIKEYRVVCIPSISKTDTVEESRPTLTAVNHLEEFVEFIKTNVGITNNVLEELAEVCKQ